MSTSIACIDCGAVRGAEPCECQASVDRRMAQSLRVPVAAVREYRKACEARALEETIKRR